MKKMVILVRYFIFIFSNREGNSNFELIQIFDGEICLTAISNYT